jgi:phosphoadenosine phosphosulfate reductase
MLGERNLAEVGVFSGFTMTTTQDLLPTFEPSERDIIQAALAQPLDRKIERAIALLKHWEPAALKLDPRGYWVADSFGKDSDCIVELAKMAGVAHHCEHNLTTLDPPELIWYGKRTRPGTHINKPAVPMLKRLAQGTKGPPTRLARWCCEEYKEQGGARVGKVVGIRIEESPRRALLWSEFVRHRKYKEAFYLCPIAYWTSADVWSFHSLRGIPHCSLYDEGFTRLGCIGCPLAGPEGQARVFARWPKYERAWRSAFDRYWRNWHGVPTLKGKRRWFEDLGSAQGLWDWWRSGKGQGDGPTCQGAELFAKNELGDEDREEE